ncbi:hypothetical protein QO004_006132 [Rhizobium mesoamericanum]|nr:hypothetical protein [Rhizobium mesoamericanum]
MPPGADEVQFQFVVDLATALLGLVRTFRRLTSKFGSFEDDDGFDELEIERQFFENPNLTLFEETPEHHFYGALARAACCDYAVADQRAPTSPTRFSKFSGQFFANIWSYRWCKPSFRTAPR